jgi:predicted RNase H-like nuclease (RuvC/YqgF family)
MEIEHLTKEKDTLRDANNKLREKLDDHEDAFNNLNRIQNELTSKDKDIERLNEKIQLME